MNKPLPVVYLSGVQLPPMSRATLAGLVRQYRRERYQFKRDTVRNYNGEPRVRKYVADVPDTLAFALFL